MIQLPHPGLVVSDRAGVLAKAFAQWLRDFVFGVQERLKATPTKTAAYTAVAWDAVMCDPTGGAFAVTLPDSHLEPGAEVLIKNVSASVNAITITAVTDDEVENGATLVLASAYGAVHLYCGTKRDGSASALGWWTI